MNGPTYTAFVADARLTTAPLPDLLRALKAHHDQHGTEVVIFEDATGRHIDFDLRGSLDEVFARALPEAPPASASSERARLGAPRTVTLLPRHWDWLDEQRGGASATLRRLVDHARKHDLEGAGPARAIEATRHFITAMAGHRPNFEEATRALYARRGDRFADLTREWPEDVRAHAERLAAPAFTSPAQDA